VSNATVLRTGQINGSGATDALFLKVFAGEVMTAFQTANVVLDKHNVRTISSGKSAQFPATWKVTAGYHTPGAEIVGQTSNLAERVINIDDLLLASVFVANIDEAMTHFETRSEYAKQCAIALGTQWDKNVLQVGVLAAAASATVSGGNGGTTLTSSGTLYRTSATDLAGALFSAAQTLDEKDIPETDPRYAFVRPAQYYLLAQSTALINKDWGGAGAYSDGKIVRVAGMDIVKTNNLPITDLSGAGVSGQKNTYVADFSKVAGLVMTKDAVGTVKLLDLATEMGYDMRRQGTLLLAKYAIGHGILRPECAVALKTTS
jgi:hypothetical protein